MKYLGYIEAAALGCMLGILWVLFLFRGRRRELDRKCNEILAQLLRMSLEKSQLKPRDELGAMAVEDALRRETRAKAALRAVLKEQGCDEKMIEMVLRDVDGHQIGDL